MFPALAFATVLVVLAAGYRAARRRGIVVFHLDQFRPSAPLVGRLPVGQPVPDRDATRANHDLRAVQSYRVEQSSLRQLDLSEAASILER